MLKTREPSPEARLSGGRAKSVCPRRICGEDSRRHRDTCPNSPGTFAGMGPGGGQQEVLTPPRRETQCKAMLENFKYRSQIQSVRHHKSVKSNLGRVQHSKQTSEQAAAPGDGSRGRAAWGHPSAREDPGSVQGAAQFSEAAEG